MRALRETLAIAGLAFQIGILWRYWSTLPQNVPTHFGISGTPDAYGGKSTMLLLPAIAVLLYVLLTVISFFPQSFNYPVVVTDENRGRLQSIALALIGWLKAELTWLFAYISWITIRVSMGRSDSLGWQFLPVSLLVVGATVTAGIVQSRRAA